MKLPKSHVMMTTCTRRSGLIVVKPPRIAPPTYNYPYNLQSQVPDDRRAAALNDLVCFTFEGRTLQPDAVTDTAIHPPLRSWLKVRFPPQ